MTKLQASMKDASAKKWRENTQMYRVGSYFKGCAHCGETEEVETKSGRTTTRYTSGHQVFRSYYPCRTKWTYLCAECGAKDAVAWDNAMDIGLDAIVGAKDAGGTCGNRVAERKMLLRKAYVAQHGDPETKPVKAAPQFSASKSAFNQEIAKLQDEIARIKQLLGGK